MHGSGKHSRLALRFGYSYSELLTREDKVHTEQLRLAIDKDGVVPGVLHVRSVMIATPRRDATTVAYIVAEARHLRTLWVANGGVLCVARARLSSSHSVPFGRTTRTVRPGQERCVGD
jgi:hypothetical protein